MTQLFRSWHRGVLPALLLLAGSALAQPAQTGGLGADPSRARYAPTAASRAAQLRTAALSLPFFDDFAIPTEGAPRADRWVQSGGTLVNNRFAVRPLTRGAVTFDALKADGTSYTFNPSPNGNGTTSNGGGYSAIDTLTSLPINLAGLAASDSVYLSFALQVGSITGPPTRNGNQVSFELQFRSNTGRWSTAPGWAPRIPAANVTKVLPFRQQLVPITQAQYLHGSFQFRFLAYGHSEISVDTWSVDYVRLDRNRTRGYVDGNNLRIDPDTTAQDVATGAGYDSIPYAGLSNPLRRYTALPVWQYNAAPAGSELNPQLGVWVQNLKPPLPLPVPWLGTARDLATGASLGTWGSATTNLVAIPTRSTLLTGDATQTAIPLTPEAKRLRYTLTLSSLETDARTLPNDTISRDVELNNYYAYDDGTAESSYWLPELATGLPPFVAYRFQTNQADQVQSLRLWPVFGLDRAARTVIIRVWADDNGKPASTQLATKTHVLPLNSGPVELFFDTPVPVSGVFYVGFGQPVAQRTLEYATDMNSRLPANTAWVTDASGAWNPLNGRAKFTREVIMMRPVMNNNILSAAAPIVREAAAFRLYPNPSRGLVTIDGPAFARATVLDALGRTAWEQPAAQAGQRQLELGTLPTGVYIVRLALPDGSVATRRLVINN